MAVGEIFNPSFLRNLYQSGRSVMPDSILRYGAVHMDTVPKVLTHVLIAIGICNVFLLLCSLAVSFLTFLVAFLLACQNASVLLTVANASPSQQHFTPPRIWTPTDFTLGVCLGITIGGSILSFFVCLTFGRVHAYCAHHSGEGPESCGWRAGSLNGVWWWSSCIFWLELVACMLLALGHAEIASSSANHQYQNIDSQDSASAAVYGGGGQYQQDVQSQPPAFAQQQQHQQQHHQQQQQQQQQQSGEFNSGGLPSYNQIPDAFPPSETQALSPSQHHQQSSSQNLHPLSPSHQLNV